MTVSSQRKDGINSIKRNITLAHNFINYCKGQFSKYSPAMDAKEKEVIAYWMVDRIMRQGLADKFEKELPIITDIEAYVCDLEWSNAIDIDEDWEKLIAAVDEFEQQLNSKYPQFSDKTPKPPVPDTYDSLVTVDDFLNYYKRVTGNYSTGLSDEDIKNASSEIINAVASNSFEKIADKHPLVNKIESLAENLEFNNTPDLYGEWMELLGCVDQLDKQINKHL